MRVRFLTSAYGPSDGVVGRHVEALAAAVARGGGDADVLLVGGHAADWFTDDGVHVTRFPGLIQQLHRRRSAPLIAALRDQSAGCDLLHLHGRQVLPVLHAARPNRLRLVFTPHYYASSPKALRHLAQGHDHRLDRRVLDEADMVVCVSHTEAVDVIRAAPGAIVRVLPNGVDAHAIAAAQPLPVDGQLIITVDRLTHWSGIERVISALPALPPSYRVVVVGGGRRRNALEAHAEYLQVNDRVRFVGAIDDAGMYRLLRSASVLMTLKKESLWGGTLLTAARAGVPVVASDLPGNREAALLAGYDDIAFVSRRASPFVLADAIERAVAGQPPDPARVPSWEQIAEQTIDAYRELLPPATARRAA